MSIDATKQPWEPGYLGEKTTIYVLVDPRTDEIRYVGKTTQSLKARIGAHLQDKCNCHRVHWLNELKREGLRPLAKPIAEMEGAWPWRQEERWWIRKLRFLGARLTNNTSGGDGVQDLPAETRERMRRVWLGRKHKPESILKLKAARALRVTSDETRAKMSRSQSGRKITWGDEIAASIRKLTPEGAAFVKLRLDVGERVTDLAKELGMHCTSISKIKMGTYFNRYPYRKK